MTTATGRSWGVLFRPGAGLRLANGKPQKGMIFHGVARAAAVPGWLVFEGPEGETIYAVPADIIAYAGDLSDENALASALNDVPVQGEA